jgi:predicted nuclease with TOPRIM domain|tara:strand:- start:902 stop:1237 length:336 start_codon:yes stop_codon:yes gene_type:complete
MSSDERHQNGWNEYSKLVLKELESLSMSIDNMNGEIQSIRQELAETRVKEDRVTELRGWKEKVDEVCSPTQLKELIEKVESLNSFKIKAIGVFIAVQFMMGALAWYLKIGG